MKWLGGIMTRVEYLLLTIPILIVNVFILFFLWFVLIKNGKKAINLVIFFILIDLFIPLVIMFPFAMSDSNFLSLGSNIYIIKDYIVKSFFISNIGILFTFLSYLFSGYLIRSVMEKKNMRKKIFLCIGYFKLIGVICLTSLLLFLFLNSWDVTMDLRKMSFENTMSRPFLNIFTTLAGVLSTFSLIMMFTKKKMKLWVALLFIVVNIFLLLSGSRARFLYPLLYYCIVVILSVRKHNKFYKLFGLGVVFTVIAIILLAIRKLSLQYTNITVIVQQILYGNTFSDIRDFGLVLRFWENSDLPFLFGKSYVAALLSFIPSSVLPLRNSFSFYYQNVRVVFSDVIYHPGFRTGFFGEPYFNFGFWGVVVVGLLLGCMYRFISIKENQILLNVSLKKYEKQLLLFQLIIVHNLFVSILLITASAYSFFLIVGTILIYRYIINVLNLSNV